MKLGEPGPDFDEIGFVAAVTELVDSQQGVVAKGIELGKVVLGVTRTASEHGVRIPADLSMLGKTLLNLDAALLMQVETSFTLLGYPGLAMILFSAAVAGVSPWP